MAASRVWGLRLCSVSAVPHRMEACPQYIGRRRCLKSGQGVARPQLCKVRHIMCAMMVVHTNRLAHADEP